MIKSAKTARAAERGAPPHASQPRRRRGLRRLVCVAVALCPVAFAAACASGASSARPAAAEHQRPPVAAPKPATARSATSPPASNQPAAVNSPVSAPPVTSPGYTGPHFDTPQAAMTYLAAAYNRNDTAALHKVTEPRAFRLLQTMRADAINLRLRYCSATPRGDYNCYFRHDFLPSLHRSGHGEAQFIAAPALNPGWYMYRFITCD